MREIVKVGMEHEKVWTLVAGALKRHNLEVENALPLVRKFSDEMQSLTGISDEAIATGVKLFVDYGQSLEQAMDTMKVAADFAVGSGYELRTAVDLLAKASVGYTGTLSRYGIIIDENIPKQQKFAEALAQIRQRFQGAASDIRDSFAVQLKLITEKIGDFREAIYDSALPALRAFAHVGVRMLDILGKRFGEIQGHVVRFYKATYESIRGIFVIMWEVVDVLRELPELASKGDWESIKGLIGGALEYIRYEGDKTLESIKAMGVEYVATVVDVYKIYADAFTEIDKNVQTSVAQTVDDMQERWWSMLKTMELVFPKLDRRFAGSYEEWREGWIATCITFEDETRARFDEIQHMAEFTFASMGDIARSAGHRIVDMMWQGEIKMREVFKQMAIDFSHFFVDAIFEILAKQFAKKFVIFMCTLFDNPIHDRMAYEEGRRFGTHFSNGVLAGVGGGSLRRGLLPAASVQAQIATAVSLIPSIEQATELGHSRLVLRTDLLTEDTDAIFV